MILTNLFINLIQTEIIAGKDAGRTHKFYAMYAVESIRMLKPSLQYSRRLFKITNVQEIM